MNQRHTIIACFSLLLWLCSLPLYASDGGLSARGYSVQMLALKPDFDGTPVAVLIGRQCPAKSHKAVLYVHGYNDYFFQDHMADWYLSQGYSFYALELRRYGRALLPGQTRYALRSVADYYEELDMAVDMIRNGHQNSFLLLHGHSMGGLVASLYASDRRASGTVDAVYLNSPFLELNAGWLVRNIATPVFTFLGGIFPNMKLPVASRPYYGESLHSDFRGEWDYDLSLKPLQNKTRAGWLRAIRRAHRRVRRGLSIECPLLVMCSDSTGSESQWNDRISVTDVVLNVEDIKKWSLALGGNVIVKVIPQARHDVMLSLPEVRKQAFDELGKWLKSL